MPGTGQGESVQEHILTVISPLLTPPGTPINAAGPSTPFGANVGFRVKNVGASNTYFPVGSSYLFRRKWNASVSKQDDA
jgi:hypothetical protein